MAEEEKKSKRKKKNIVPEEQYNDTLDKNLDIPPESLEEAQAENLKAIVPEEALEEELPEEALEEELPEEALEEELEEEPEEEPEEELPEEESAENALQYDQLKQELLQEYTDKKNINLDDEQLQQNQEEVEDELENEEDMNEGVTEQNQEQPESQPKYDFDDDLEIENVNANPETNLDNEPKPLSSAQKAIAPDVDQGLSKVAISKGSSLAIMVGLILLLAFIIYKVMQPSAEELATITKSEIDNKLPISKPVEDSGQTIIVPEIPTLPEAPILTAPIPIAAPAPPPPPVMDMTAPNSVPAQAVPASGTSKVGIIGLPGIDVRPKDSNATAKDAADAARRKARITSSMMAGGSGGGAGDNKKGMSADGKSLTILQRNADQVVATHIGELQRVIAQGKIIDAVLETAINTDLPGMIRAIVAQDVYSEAGKNILIPRGSRLVGAYSSSVKYGQNRVQVVWDRIIRPDGVDIKVSSPGVDDLGRSGSVGEVDNHILRNLATAMMISFIDISLAKYADERAPTSGTTTSTVSQPNDSTQAQTTTTTGSVQTQESQAFDSAVNKIGAIGQDLMQKNMNMPATITVDQGTTLKVFVKRDLVFPGRSANLTRLIE